MRILDARIHAFCDVFFVLAFALGPFALGLGGSPAIISFLLAVAFVVLAVTGWAGVRSGRVVVPIPHGLVELVLALLLAFMPRLDGYAPGSPARHFYWTMAAALIVVWLLTAYGHGLLVREKAGRGETLPGTADLARPPASRG